ncbi:MAG: hypothetical protein ACYTEE_10020 [Planctomycetota bacterium]|jgi:hypothetical protein
MEFQGTETGKREFPERDAEQNRLDVLRDEYYKVVFTPTNVELTGSAVLGAVNSNPVVVLGGGANDAVRATFPKPELWRNGEASVLVYWSTDGTDSTVQQLKIALRGIGVVGSAMSNTTVILETKSIAPSGTADVLYDDEWTTITNPILDTYDVLSFVFQRLGVADGNTDDTYFLGAIVEFLPVHRQ